MKHIKYIALGLLVVLLLASAATISAQGGTPPQGQPPQGQAGDRAGGIVTAVNDSTISAENPQGKVTIVANTSTKFTANGQANNLASVTAGKFVQAIGQKQADGSWVATRVSISDSPPMPPPQGQQPGQGQPPQGKQQQGQPPQGQGQGDSVGIMQTPTLAHSCRRCPEKYGGFQKVCFPTATL
jgi:hypothetical protein